MMKPAAKKKDKGGGSGPQRPAEPAYLQTLQKLRIVIRAAQRHSAWIEKQCGVTGAQLWALQELQDAPGARVGDIASRLAIHQTTASNLLDALERAGYLTKLRDAPDHRVVTLRLSETGEVLLTRCPRPARGLLAEALAGMSRDALAQLDAGLQALLQAIAPDDDAYAMQLLPFMMRPAGDDDAAD